MGHLDADPEETETGRQVNMMSHKTLRPKTSKHRLHKYSNADASGGAFVVAGPGDVICVQVLVWTMLGT